VVTVTATSQGNNGASDSALLTTTVDPVFGVALSADDGQTNWAGQTVTYTVSLTNTGNVPDTFDLGLSGNSWPTSLTALSMALGPNSAGSFSVVVDIPPGALSGDFDAVTITATSQGNAGKSDTAVLTTFSEGLQAKIYVPAILNG
jgi:uncharacterized membrane protein